MGPSLAIKRYAAEHPEEEGGVIEVSQNITEIQKLEGEHRLLDWE